ncbi:MAG: molybdenum ABC transporter ATP-binding protein [Acidobacteria bacterium]|nr:molybdenum ABC transporter ATP-binding protein [Acidobacteriota bacterium]
MRGRFQLARGGGFVLDVDFTAPPTGVTGVFGPSASGKTTLLRCVAGLERAPAGLLEVAGEVWQDEERGWFVPAHRRRVGYVFQEAGLFAHLSVRRNLEYGLRRTPAAERRVRFEEAVEWLGLGPLLPRVPEALSGGQRQRVAVARALLTSPRLLLMDEPLAALDARAREDILPYFERLHAQLEIPVLYVSHSAAELLRLADHLLLLAAGKVRAAGPLALVSTRLDLLPWGPEAELGVVVEAVVAGHDERFGLTYLDFAGGRLSLPRHAAAAPGSRQRVRVLARDVSLALERPERTSVLNVFPARIVEIDAPSAAGAAGRQPLVKLDAGGAALLAQVTHKSLAVLDLRPGVPVYAVIKGVALLMQAD